MQLRLLVLMLLASVLTAQSVSFGLRAGVPATSSLHAAGGVTQPAGLVPIPARWRAMPRGIRV
jgi:hypothetical protein